MIDMWFFITQLVRFSILFLAKLTYNRYQKFIYSIKNHIFPNFCREILPVYN